MEDSESNSERLDTNFELLLNKLTAYDQRTDCLEAKVASNTNGLVEFDKLIGAVKYDVERNSTQLVTQAKRIEMLECHLIEHSKLIASLQLKLESQSNGRDTANGPNTCSNTADSLDGRVCYPGASGPIARKRTTNNRRPLNTQVSMPL